MRYLSIMKQGLLDLIWPERQVCVCCGRLSENNVICSECSDALCALPIEAPFCPRCGKPLANEHRTCGCHLPEGLTVRSVWTYEDPAGKLVRTLKFNQIREAAEPLIEAMTELIREQSESLEDVCVTWVTMAKSHGTERGFDHAELLAQGIAKELSLPCRQLLLRSKKNVRHQVGLGRRERLSNLQGTFAPAQLAQISTYQTVILIDDVYTTGATMMTAAECLLESCAQQVFAVTAVRAMNKDADDDI